MTHAILRFAEVRKLTGLGRSSIYLRIADGLFPKPVKLGLRMIGATPYHSWERGTNENTNGLIRQYLTKRRSMKGLTQPQCNAIAGKLNRRSRKRHGFLTPDARLQLGKSKRPTVPPHYRLQRRTTFPHDVSSTHVSVAVQS